MVATRLHEVITRYAVSEKYLRKSHVCRGWPPGGHPALTERSICSKTGASEWSFPVWIRNGHLVATVREDGMAPRENLENGNINRRPGEGWLIDGHPCEKRADCAAVHRSASVGQVVGRVCSAVHRSDKKRATAPAGRAGAHTWMVHAALPTSSLMQSSWIVNGNAQGGHQVATHQELQGIWHV